MRYLFDSKILNIVLEHAVIGPILVITPVFVIAARPHCPSEIFLDLIELADWKTNSQLADLVIQVPEASFGGHHLLYGIRSARPARERTGEFGARFVDQRVMP